ncbi:MAG: cytochrome C biogenesis protein CcdA [Omnitrophica WOR_2 bacterium GWA2_47_8]|nr:MAG: cytochrome C biogenesis protein CcdA [Omnitrophica WOR_2 bacterium GWA2_47_8]
MKQPSKHIIAFVTTADKEEARKIAGHLIEKKLAACVNIVSGVGSIYWWEGKVDTSQEVLMVIKSQSKLFTKIVSAVKQLHSYQCPEIIALPIAAGQKDYLKWIDDSINRKDKG